MFIFLGLSPPTSPSTADEMSLLLSDGSWRRSLCVDHK
jgi:hypothetical protein